MVWRETDRPRSQAYVISFVRYKKWDWKGHCIVWIRTLCTTDVGKLGTSLIKRKWLVYFLSTRQCAGLRGIRLGLLWASPRIKEVLAKPPYALYKSTTVDHGSFFHLFFFCLNCHREQEGMLSEWFLNSFTETVEFRVCVVGQNFCAGSS